MAGYATVALAFAAVKKYDFDARIDADLASAMDLCKTHVGAAAPTTFFVGKQWFDSGNAVLKVCSAVSEAGVATWTACFTAA